LGLSSPDSAKRRLSLTTNPEPFLSSAIVVLLPEVSC
jgi:hypothetical protein